MSFRRMESGTPTQRDLVSEQEKSVSTVARLRERERQGGRAKAG
jgi:hypothetical protein